MPSSPHLDKLRTQALASDLEHHIRARGNYTHVTVRVRGRYLYLENGGEVVARVEPTSRSTYGLSFRSHTGRWEPMPVHGTLIEVAAGVVDTLGPFL